MSVPDSDSFVTIDRLMTELEFAPVDEDTAIGELSELPAAFTVLGIEPLSGMFQFRINPDGADASPLGELLAPFAEDEVSFSIEEKYAWFSLYNLEELEFETLCHLVREVAARLQAGSYALPGGCLRCGAVTGVQLVVVEGSPTRVCSNCLEEAAQQRQQQEADLNRSSLSATIGLPFAGFLVAAVWAILWFVIDLLLGYWDVQVIIIDQFSILIMLLSAGGLGYLIGWPAGVVMRRSAAIQIAPYTTIAWFLLAAGLCGEIPIWR